MKRFITDMVREHIATSNTGESVMLPRFAVWVVRRDVYYDGVPYNQGSRPLVIAVSNDLQELLNEHGDMPVFRLDELETTNGETE